jgi:hypothetical protein
MPLDVTWTRRATRLPEEVRSEIARRLETLHQYFPEMTPRMRVGLTRMYDGLAFQSDQGNVKLMLGAHKSRKGGWQYPTHWTIAHELMHLAQFNSHGIPSGERACDVYALSRLPPRLIDDSPSYLVISKRLRRAWGPDFAKLAHDLALEALRRREGGLRTYASWWEDEFEVRAERLLKDHGEPDPPSPAPGRRATCNKDVSRRS